MLLIAVCHNNKPDDKRERSASETSLVNIFQESSLCSNSNLNKIYYSWGLLRSV